MHCNVIIIFFHFITRKKERNIRVQKNKKSGEEIRIKQGTIVMSVFTELLSYNAP